MWLGLCRLATGAGLFVLILLSGPVSGAHFNPVVTLAMALLRRLPPRDALAYAVAQVGGAVAGERTAHLMFDEPLLQVSVKLRDGPVQMAAEGVGPSCCCSSSLAARGFGSRRWRARWRSPSPPHTGSSPRPLLPTRR